MNTETPQALIEKIALSLAEQRHHDWGMIGSMLQGERLHWIEREVSVTLDAIRSLPVEDRASLLGFTEVEVGSDSGDLWVNDMAGEIFWGDRYWSVPPTSTQGHTESIRRGVAQAEAGQVVDLGSFSQYADDE